MASLSQEQVFITAASLTKPQVAIFAGGMDGYCNVSSVVDIYHYLSGNWSMETLSAGQMNREVALVGGDLALFGRGWNITTAFATVDLSTH